MPACAISSSSAGAASWSSGGRAPRRTRCIPLRTSWLRRSCQASSRLPRPRRRQHSRQRPCRTAWGNSKVRRSFPDHEYRVQRREDLHFRFDVEHRYSFALQISCFYLLVESQLILKEYYIWSNSANALY
jgi:hypothetical protein